MDFKQAFNRAHAISLNQNLEDSLVHEVEMYWYTNQRYPTSGYLKDKVNANGAFGALQTTDIEDALRSSTVASKLNNRGVNRWLGIGEIPPTELDPLRMNIALEISNVHGEVRIHERLTELGISETQYRGWQQDPLFLNFLKMRSLKLVDEEMGAINRSLLRKASAGDQRATKLVMEMTGRIASGTTVNVNAFQSGKDPMVIVRKLVEIIRRHVQDPKVIGEIYQEFAGVLDSQEPLEAVVNRLAVESKTITPEGSPAGGYTF